MPLPRYVRRKPLRSGQWAYFFEVPTWARKAGCQLANEALGTDYAAAVRRAEDVLLPQLDSWRTGGLSDLRPMGPTLGTLDWLIAEYKAHRTYSELGRWTKMRHEIGFDLVAGHVLKDGRTLGSVPLAAIETDIADRVYDRLLHVEERDEATGTIVRRERRATANHAMKSCRRAWFVVARLHPKTVPARNPFSKMGLKAQETATPTATLDELRAFVAAADRMGRASLGTAAWMAWEWAPREEDVFGTFEAGHYRPKERPGAVRVIHEKTREEAWIPLFDDDGSALYPELTSRLDALRAGRIAGLMIVRDWKEKDREAPAAWVTESGDLTYMRHEVKRIIRAAGLRDELSFRSFRHGGITEAADADATDREIQAVTRHRSAKVLPRYAKRTMTQVSNVARKRRASREKLA
jgi:hypothetical protein